ncbi:MAG: hypothetical protein N2487_04490 [Verrucomicrobiae bacterium]|nr:hypothetical protein [Verrucomicrobiae bacterium]
MKIVAGITALVFLAVAILKPQVFKLIWQKLEHILDWIAKSTKRAVAVVFIISFCLNAGITLIIGESPPHIHDEFANLLAADTFAHGRVSNPPHPMWKFFEAIHVLSHPAYVSKYPPAQGMMLAIGQVLFNRPVFGSWLSAALAAAGICWALSGWMRPKWAVFGGLLAVFHPILLKWSQVFWGGSEAMLGGALVFGAVGRLATSLSAFPSFTFGIGTAILGLSRPFEGLVLTILCSAFLIIRFIKNGILFSHRTISRVYLPIAITGILFLAWTGYYNWRITSNPLKMPYMVYEEQYAVAPFLLIQKPRPIPAYNHEFIKRHFVEYAMDEYNRQQTITGFIKEKTVQFKRIVKGYSWTYALLPLCIALPWMIRRRLHFSFPLICFILFMLAMFLETWMWDRYVAPIGVVFFCLVVEAFRRFKLWHCCKKPFGYAVVIAILALCCLQTLLWMKTRKWEYSRRDWDWQRAQMIKRLESEGGKHLIFVRYGHKQSVHNDWVHNSADIDNSKVVWARDMGKAENKKLIEYFRDRKIWLIEAENEYDPPPDKIQKVELKPYE